MEYVPDYLTTALGMKEAISNLKNMLNVPSCHNQLLDVLRGMRNITASTSKEFQESLDALVQHDEILP